MGDEGRGACWGCEKKIPKEPRKRRNVSGQSSPVAGGAGSCAPSSPRARARLGRAGLEEAEGLRRQEVAAAAGDTCRWGP